MGDVVNLANIPFGDKRHASITIEDIVEICIELVKDIECELEKIKEKCRTNFAFDKIWFYNGKIHFLKKNSNGKFKTIVEYVDGKFIYKNTIKNWIKKTALEIDKESLDRLLALYDQRSDFFDCMTIGPFQLRPGNERHTLDVFFNLFESGQIIFRYTYHPSILEQSVGIFKHSYLFHLKYFDETTSSYQSNVADCKITITESMNNETKQLSLLYLKLIGEILNTRILIHDLPNTIRRKYMYRNVKNN